MYTSQQIQTVKQMSNWLCKTNWDYFSTITYRYDIRAKQNFKIMTGLEDYLKSLRKPFMIKND